MKMNGFLCFLYFLSFLLDSNGFKFHFFPSQKNLIHKRHVADDLFSDENLNQSLLNNVSTHHMAEVFRKKMEELKNRKEVELVILVDGSYSIGPKNFFSEMKFIQKVISDVEVGAKAFRLGIVIYSTEASIQVDHLSFTDSSDIEKCSLLHFDIPKISYPGSNTNTKEALEKAEKILTRSRMGASKIVFLLTDGFSNMGNPLSASDILKEQGIELFTFGIRNGNVKELEAMASMPIEEHAYLFASFEDFEGFARRALHQDLPSGSYVSAKNSTSCNLLCLDSVGNGCCSPEAMCSCGLISGHFACLCPPGYYGSGLIGEGCTICPEGTYSEGLSPGDVLSCTPCPDVHHVITKYPATSRNHCICGNGTVAEGDVCKIVSCPPLLPPANGYFVKKKCSSVVNAACGVRCHMGFELSGSSVRICQKNGTWSGTDPICLAKSCLAPKPVPSSSVTCTNEDDKTEIVLNYDKNGRQTFPEENELSQEISNSTSNYAVGTVCSFACDLGHHLIGSKSRSCLPMLKWSGLKATCKSIKCPSFPTLSKGSIKPQNCTEPGVKHPFGTVCRFHCDPGYELKGPKIKNCTGKHGTWTGKNNLGKCVDVEPPAIECPGNLSVKTDEDVHFATVQLKLPETSDNSGKEPVIWSKPPFKDDFPLRLIIGINEIEIYSVDEAGNYGVCTFAVEVKDEEKPKILECRSPPVFFVNELLLGSIDMTWKEPVFDDNSGIPITVNRTPNTRDFPKGTTSVTYLATDAAGNSASCTINITILENPCWERPSDTNTLWNCSTNQIDDSVTCTVLCPEGMSLVTDSTGPAAKVFHCRFYGRKAYWTPNIFGGDVDLFPECSEIIAPEEIKDEIVIEATSEICEDLNSLSNDIISEAVTNEGDLSIFCEDGDEFEDEVIEEKSEPHKHFVSEVLDETTINVMTTEKEADFISEDDGQLVTLIGSTGSTFRETIQTATERQSITEESSGSSNTEKIKIDSSDEFTEEKSKSTNDVPNNTNDMISSTPIETSDPINLKHVMGREEKFWKSNRSKRSMKKGRKRVRIRINKKGSNVKGEILDSDTMRKLDALRRIYDKNGEDERFPDLKAEFVCKRGSLPLNGVCVKCPKGTFHETKSSTCRPCPLGHYQEDEGQSECIPCPEGFSTKKIRRKHAKQCKKICPSGTFGHATSEAALALAPCTVCPVGFYQHLQGSTSCVACPNNLTTQRSGATDANFCVSLSALNDPCHGFICRNGGSCQAQEGYALCICSPGFSGSFCERTFDPCGSAPCYNGGSCEYSGPLEYFCRCLPGFQGSDCETDIDECSSDPCNGRGECTDMINGFRCDCAHGFKGATCNETIGHCVELEPCINGGKCLELPDGSYTCVCPEGFSGQHCDIQYECSSGDCDSDPSIPMSTFELCASAGCRENERCVIEKNKKVKCVCADGFRGVNCSEEINAGVILRFPKYGVTEYAIADFPEGNFTQLSICVWIETKDTFNYGTIFSYATYQQDNAFTLTDYSGLVLYVMGHHVVTDLQANDGFWHFLCVTWETLDGRWQVFFDGHLFSNGSGLSDRVTIPGSGKLVIGQEQDVLGGGFNDVESFAGRLTNFDVWDRVLEPSEIKSLFEDCKNNFGSAIPWLRFLQAIHGEIKEEHSTFCQLCNASLTLFRGKITYDFIDGVKVATYWCDEGFIIKFDSSANHVGRKKVNFYQRKCMKFGGWHSKEPKCKRKSCGFPGYFFRGSISGRSYKFGDEIVYKCFEGYVLEGNDTRKCLSDGTWSGTAPHCRGNSTECKKLLAPRHGSMFVYYKGQRAYSTSLVMAGDRVEFTCDRGYEIIGFGILTCTDGGFWDREPPICEKTKCQIPPELYHFLPTTEIAKRTFYVDDLLTITCPSGKRRALKCEIHGIWNITSTKICKNVCRTWPNEVENGYIVKNQMEMPLEEGEKLRVVCQPEHTLLGNDFFECSENGTWIQSYPTFCRRNKCGPPPPPPPAYQIVHEEGHDIGQRIFLRCSPGYTTTGPIFIQCQPNGRYSRVQNICKKILCDAPILPWGYSFQGTPRRVYSFGSKIPIECPQGKNFSSGYHAYLECQFDGTWSSLPECI